MSPKVRKVSGSKKAKMSNHPKPSSLSSESATGTADGVELSALRGVQELSSSLKTQALNLPAVKLPSSDSLHESEAFFALATSVLALEIAHNKVGFGLSPAQTPTLMADLEESKRVMVRLRKKQEQLLAKNLVK